METALTGTIEKSDAKSLIIKTEFAGEVTVDWSAVQEITSSAETARESERRKDSIGNRDHNRRQPGGSYRRCGNSY